MVAPSPKYIESSLNRLFLAATAAAKGDDRRCGGQHAGQCGHRAERFCNDCRCLCLLHCRRVHWLWSASQFCQGTLPLGTQSSPGKAQAATVLCLLNVLELVLGGQGGLRKPHPRVCSLQATRVSLCLTLPLRAVEEPGEEGSPDHGGGLILLILF